MAGLTGPRGPLGVGEMLAKKVIQELWGLREYKETPVHRAHREIPARWDLREILVPWGRQVHRGKREIKEKEDRGENKGRRGSRNSRRNSCYISIRKYPGDL